jgi:hypothetical protein
VKGDDADDEVSLYSLSWDCPVCRNEVNVDEFIIIARFLVHLPCMFVHSNLTNMVFIPHPNHHPYIDYKSRVKYSLRNTECPIIMIMYPYNE